jgi:hypothetical protein
VLGHLNSRYGPKGAVLSDLNRRFGRRSGDAFKIVNKLGHVVAAPETTINTRW